MYRDDHSTIVHERNEMLRRRDEARNNLYITYAICISLASFIMLLAMAMAPIIRWIDAIADDWSARAKMRELEFEVAKSDADIPDVRTVTEYISIEHSWLYKFFWNWALPSVALIIILAFIVVICFEIYKRYHTIIRHDSARSFSVFSISISMTSMVFAVLRYRKDLLQHEASAYIFLSSLLCTAFFLILLLTNNKRAALIVYSLGLLFVAFISWFTSGSYMAIVLEYRELLSTMLIPYQAVAALGAFLPIILVIIGALTLNKGYAERR